MKSFQALKNIFTQSKSIKGLDGLRAVCALMVLIDHVGLTKSAETGTFAVWVFFCLSGFLITPLLFRARVRYETGETTRREALFSFIFNRALRIFPVYYASLAIAIPLAFWFGGGENVEKVQGSLVWLLTYTTNIYIGFVREDWLGPLSHLWTLAVEQQFYVVFPLVFVFIPSRNWLSSLLFGAALMIFAAGLIANGNELAYRVNSLSGFYAISVGGFCGLMLSKYPRLGEVRTAGPVMLAIFVFMVALHVLLIERNEPAIALIVIPLIGSLLLVMMSSNQDNIFIRLLEIPVLRALGVVSYGFYLFHGFVLGASGRFVAKVTGIGDGLAYELMQTVTATLLTMAISLVSFIFFESKFMALKPSHRRKNAAAPSVDPAATFSAVKAKP